MKQKTIFIIIGIFIASVIGFFVYKGHKKATEIKKYLVNLKNIIDTYVIENNNGLSMSAKPANLSLNDASIFDMIKNSLAKEPNKFSSKENMYKGHYEYIKATNNIFANLWY